MPQIVSCSCGRRYRLTDEQARKRSLTCKQCGEKIDLTGASSTAEQPADTGNPADDGDFLSQLSEAVDGENSSSSDHSKNSSDPLARPLARLVGELLEIVDDRHMPDEMSGLSLVLMMKRIGKNARKVSHGEEIVDLKVSDRHSDHLLQGWVFAALYKACPTIQLATAAYCQYGTIEVIAEFSPEVLEGYGDPEVILAQRLDTELHRVLTQLGANGFAWRHYCREGAKAMLGELGLQVEPRVTLRQQVEEVQSGTRTLAPSSKVLVRLGLGPGSQWVYGSRKKKEEAGCASLILLAFGLSSAVWYFA